MSGGESLRESAVFNLGGAVTMIVDDSPFSLTLTANALAQHLDEALAAGADRHMAKPFSVEDLLAMVSDLTAQTPQAAEAAA